MATTPAGLPASPWLSGWWRGRPYGSDDGTQVGFAELEVDLLGQPLARLSVWTPIHHLADGSGEPATGTALDGDAPLGAWDNQIWLRYDSIEGVVDHILREGDQTIVVSSTVPTADCAAVFGDAASYARDAMPDSFLAACFTALAASAPDLELAPATASDASEVADARASANTLYIPEAPWQAVDLVGYLEALVVAEAAGITSEDAGSLDV